MGNWTRDIPEFCAESQISADLAAQFQHMWHALASAHVWRCACAFAVACHIRECFPPSPPLRVIFTPGCPMQAMQRRISGTRRSRGGTRRPLLPPSKLYLRTLQPQLVKAAAQSLLPKLPLLNPCPSPIICPLGPCLAHICSNLHPPLRGCQCPGKFRSSF